MPLNWVLILWSMTASASLTLAAIHFLVWQKSREAWANLLFSVLALAAVGTAGCELWMMRAATPAEFGMALRFYQLAVWAVLLSMVGFVLLHLRAGRPWLAWTTCALRSLALLLNFRVGQNLNYLEITGLRHVRFLGESVAVAIGTPNPWMIVGQVSLVLFMVFFTDAAISVWRRGERRQAFAIGGSIIFCVAGASIQAFAVLWEFVHAPLTSSLFFIATVVAMSYEMSRDVLRAAKLAANLEESEVALRQSEFRLDQAAQAAGIGTWEWNAARNELWVSERGRALIGIAAGRRIHFNDVLDVVHPEDRDTVRDAFLRELETGGIYEQECRVLLPGGGVRWIATRGRIDTGSGGEPVSVRGVSFDVTERRSAQERFERLIDCAPVGIILVNSSGRITLANRQIERDFGYSRLELIDQPVERLIAEPLAGEHKVNVETFFADPATRSMADRIVLGRRKDGHDIPVEIGLNPIETVQGPAVVATVVDITERLKATKEIAQQRHQFEHLSRVSTLNELSGSIGHELNQPLQAILSNAQAARLLLANENPNLDEVRETLNDIVRDNKRAGEIIWGLRSLLKKGDIRFESLNLNGLLRDVLRLVTSELLNAGVTVTVTPAPELPPVKGDRVQLQQVLLNLILNGCEAMAGVAQKERELLLTTQSIEAGRSVLVCVTDRGPGIPPQDLERVFDAFYTTKAQGLGVGLAVCRGIISAHGGRLWAANNQGRGARFCFSLAAK
jgi:two-component system, LuxR family, sensor kinase FixL